MKNLGKTIDRLLKVDPALEDKLIPIKNKWKKYPGKSMSYWKELIDFLNTDPDMVNHPKRPEIHDIFTVKKRPQRQHLNSFEAVNPTDTILGVIPENLADEIKRHDRQSIEVTKLHVEANITRCADLLAEVSRKESFLDISNKKLWHKLKDYFQLWGRNSNVSIKKQENGLLAMVEYPYPSMPQRPSSMSHGNSNPNIIKMDPNSLRQFLQFLGMDPPPSDE
jgi:hypothetical protein